MRRLGPQQQFATPGTAAAPAWSFTGFAGHGFFAGSNFIGIAGNGVEVARFAADGGGFTLNGQYTSFALVDPVTGGAKGGAHRLTSAGNGTFYWQISNSAAAFGPGGTAINAWSIGPDGGFTFLQKVGFNGATPVGKQTLPAAATDAASTMTLANALRTALINLGLAQ